MKAKHKKTLVLWMLLIAMFVAIWRVMSPDGRGAPASQFETDPAYYAELGALAAALIGAVWGLARWNKVARQHSATLDKARGLLDGGEVDEAERALGEPRASRLRVYQRSALLVAAEVASARLDRDAALARLDEAVALSPARLAAAGDRAVTQRARAARALLRASAGDEAGAREDMAAATDGKRLRGASGASVVLAEALILERDGDRAALRAHLDRNGDLLRSGCPTRDRALVRALDAFVADAGASVYRRPAAAETPEAGRLVAYVAWMCPAAAPFARAGATWTGPATPLRMPPPSDDATARAAAYHGTSKRPASSPPNLKILAIWGVLVVAFLSFWQLKEFADGPAFEGVVIGASVALVVGLAAWVVVARRRARDERERVDAGVAAYEAGDLAAATEALSSPPRGAWLRVRAHNFRAAVALAEGDADVALEAVDAAFTALAAAQGGVAQRPAAPKPGEAPVWDLARALASQRAHALAALGRRDDARAEIAWANGFPGDAVTLLVEVVAAARIGDVSAAAALLQAGRSEASAADEVLFQMIAFVATPAARTDVDAAWIERELGRSAGLRLRCDRFAPGLCDHFSRALAESRGYVETPAPA